MSEPTASANPTAPDSLPTRYGLGMATWVIISSMVGVGVLTTSGFTVASVGSNQLMIGLWVVGGLIALCGALTSAELATSLPASGGDYIYLLEAYGPLAAFLSGWVSFLIGFGGPIAVTAFAASSYLLAPLRLPSETAEIVYPALATVAILGFALLHTVGARHSGWAQSAITVLKLAILVSFAAVGLAAAWGNAPSHLHDRPPLSPATWQAMLFSLVYISYGYTGWNAAGYMAGEVREPSRTLPRAIVLGTLGVLLLYIGLNLVYALALTAGVVQGIVRDKGFDAVAPIAEIAANRLYGPRLTAPLSIAIGLTLFASLSAYILTGPRVAFAMARAGHFPAIAGRLTQKGRTPAVATALQVSWSLILLWSGSFEKIVIYASVGLALFSMLTISSVFALRIRRPELPRPFRTPGYPFTPALFLALTTLLTAAAFLERPRVSFYALLSIAVGIPVYYLAVRSRRVF